MNSKLLNLIEYLIVIILLAFLIGCSNNESKQDQSQKNQKPEIQSDSSNTEIEDDYALIIKSRIQTMNIHSIPEKVNALIHDNKYFEYESKFMSTKRDTVTDSYKGTIFEYSITVHSSRNREYFVIHFDTTCLAPIGIETGCDSPTKTHLYFCHGDKILWKETRENSIADVYFFEDNGSSLVSWDDVWADNYHLFYDRNGGIFDTISAKQWVYELNNNRIILLEHRRNKFNKLICIDNTGTTLWSDELIFDKGMQRRFHIADDGSKFMLEYQDSMVLYNSEREIIWKGANPDFNTYGHFLQGGKYFLKSTNASLRGNQRILIYNKDNPEVTHNYKTIQITDL